jgi:uncharacterized protein YndB with AHSA1/START domain
MARSDAAAKAAQDAGSATDRRLRIVRNFAAPREAVFRAWTDPKQLVKWWGPKGYACPECTVDMREGGRWRTVMRSPEGTNHIVGGVYRKIEPHSLLAFTWAWATDGAPGHETLVTVEFHERGKTTEMVFTQETFESVTARDQHSQGWNSAFECLEDFFREE